MHQALSLVVHVLATVVWVGGMFFAHQVLRPVTLTLLEPPARLALWRAVFGRFFVWVWSAVILLPLTGYFLLFSGFGSMGAAPLYVHIMNGLGLVMISLFVFVFLVPYRRLRAAVATQDWKAAGAQLAIIRPIVATNLILGLLTTVVATGGSYL